MQNDKLGRKLSMLQKKEVATEDSADSQMLDSSDNETQIKGKKQAKIGK